MSKKAEKLMQSARAQLAILEPFFSTLLFKYPLKKADFIPTACVDPKGQIYYNAEFVEKLSVYELQFLLCHEVLHIVYQHTLRRGERDPRLWNYACDMVINETLVSLNVGTPLDGCLRYHGAETMTSEQVYERIKDQEEFQSKGSEGNNWGSSDTQNGTGDSLSDIVGNGDASSTPQENDPLAEARKKLGGALTESERRRVSAEAKINASEAASMARMSGSNIGTAKGNFLRRLDEFIMAERFPWHKALAQFMNKFVNQDQSWKRPNRRFQDVYLPTTDRQPAMGDLVIGIDTSGSIGDKELAFFGAHVNTIIEECKPEKIYLLWCDTEVDTVEEFTLEDLPIEFTPKGGGGTDMRAITHWVNDNTPDADVCVIFTDGYTPYPIDGEETVYTKWVLTTDYEAPDHIDTLHFDMED